VPDENGFFEDRKTQDAVVRQIEIIGEATKKLSDGLRQGYPEIPWSKIAGRRDKLIPDYMGVDPEVVWLTAREDVPKLGQEIDQILTDLIKAQGG